MRFQPLHLMWLIVLSNNSNCKFLLGDTSMIFKYNRYDINEKNLYYLSMVTMLNYGIFVNLFFVLGAMLLVLQTETIDFMTIIYALIIVLFGISLFVIDAIYRIVILKKELETLVKFWILTFWENFLVKSLIRT